MTSVYSQSFSKITVLSPIKVDRQRVPLANENREAEAVLELINKIKAEARREPCFRRPVPFSFSHGPPWPEKRAREGHRVKLACA